MSAEVDAQKLELLRSALPNGLAAGESGLVESRGMPDVMNGFPQFRSAITQSKQYSQTPPITVDPPATQSAKIDLPSHPWKITIRTVENSYEYAIETASRLFDGFGGESIEVNGADGEFRNLEEGFYFIEVDFNEDGDIEQAQIQIGEDIGDLIETSGDPPEQTKLRQEIGYVYFEDDVPKVKQNAWHNYTLLNTGINGVICKTTFAT